MSAREEIFGKLGNTDIHPLPGANPHALSRKPSPPTPLPRREGSFEDELPDDIASDLITDSYAVETASVEQAGDVLALFIRNLEEAGGEVQVFTSADDLRAWLREFVETNSIASAITSTEEFVRNLGIAASLKDVSSVNVVEMGEKDVDYRTYTEQAQLGIGLAHAGIAESGAILIASSPQESRSLSLLVETHVAILDAKNLRKRLPDAAPIIDDLLMNAAAAVTIVAGPSKTADIEKVLITGVHGPGRFIVCILNRE